MQNCDKLQEIKDVLEEKLQDSDEIVLFKDFMAKKATSSVTVRELYMSGVGLCLQGVKEVKASGRVFTHSPGKIMGAFVPAPIEFKILEASAEKPFIGLGMFIDNNRLTRILLKLSTIKNIEAPGGDNPAGMFEDNISNNDEIIDIIYRLVKLLDKPTELQMLGDGLLDEMYFKILYNPKWELYKHLLHNKGHFKHIANSVEYIYANIDRILSVEELAEKANMSVSGFHKKFKDIMHMSPLQYIKEVKLDKAKSYLLGGLNVSQSANKVGYNSLAQFSREYKRHFGVLPSKRIN